MAQLFYINKKLDNTFVYDMMWFLSDIEPMKEPKAKTMPPSSNVFSTPKPAGEEPLVNENQEGTTEYVSDPNTPPPPEQSREEELVALVAKLEEENGKLRIKNNELTGKLQSVEKQKSNYSDVSRKFRIFLNIVQGFVSRGLLDPSELAKKPGTEHNLMKHAAGLAEVANKATENRF